METIALKCGTDTVLASCDTNWAGTASPSLDTTNKKVGTGSVTFTTTGTGLQTYKALVSPVDLSSLLAVELWIQVVTATDSGKFSFRLSTAADASTTIEDIPIPALSIGWNLIVVEIANPLLCTEINSIGLLQLVSGAVVVHLDNVLAVNARLFETYGVRGFDDVDAVRLWPPTQNDCPDGERRTVYSGFARMPSFKIAPTTKAARVWLVVDFCMSTVRKLVYANEEVSVCFESEERPFASEWLHGTALARAYAMSLNEVSVRSSTPDAWN